MERRHASGRQKETSAAQPSPSDRSSSWWAGRPPSRADKIVTLRLAVISLAGLALFVATYALAVRTIRGQLLGNAALAGQRVVLEGTVLGAKQVLESLSVASLAAGTLALVVIALLRRRPRLALMTALTVVGSLVISELMKAVILDRPGLVGAGIYPRQPPFPASTFSEAVLPSVLVKTTPAPAFFETLFE